jgi:hypothetical protein
MHSRVFLTGDSTPTWLDAPPDVVVSTLEHAGDTRGFVRFDMVADDDAPAPPAYIRPSAVASVMALSPDVVARHRAGIEED